MLTVGCRQGTTVVNSGQLAMPVRQNDDRTLSGRLLELGLTIAPASAPKGRYKIASRSGSLLFISGQVSQENGRASFFGCLGENMDVATGRRAAESAALGILTQLIQALGDDVSAVRSVVRLTVYVAAARDFVDHPMVADGASELLLKVFGAAGEHARSAVGVASLPRGVAVEIDSIFELA